MSQFSKSSNIRDDVLSNTVCDPVYDEVKDEQKSVELKKNVAYEQILL